MARPSSYIKMISDGNTIIMMILSIAPLLTQRYLVTYDGFRRRAHLLTQCLFTWSRKIKLFEPSKGIFRDPTKYWTTKTRKRLSICQKWFLRPYFPLIRGVFVFRSGLRFLFRALKVPKPRVKMTFSSLSVWALSVPETKI